MAQPKSKIKPLILWDRPRGIVTESPEGLLGLNDAKTADNLQIIPSGGRRFMYKTRPGIKRITGTAADGNAAIKFMTQIPIDGTSEFLVVDANHKLYSYAGGEPTLEPGAELKTLEGEATIVPFNGEGIVLDGSYIKKYDGTSVSLAYDNGSGPDGYNYDNVEATLDDTQSLYFGAVTRAAQSFTTQELDTGYTIPLRQVDVWLSKTGTPTGNISVKLYNSAGTSLLATMDTTKSAADLTAAATLCSFTLAAGTYALASNTTYRVSIEFSGGDATNYVSVHGEAVASGGGGYTYSGSWSADATIDFAVGVKPGRPPKGKFGDVKESRLFVSNGDGRVPFCNIKDPLDWSTPRAAGYVGAVDDDANGFAVGAISAFYGDLYVFGQQAQPYLTKLTGATPAEYSLPPLFQKPYTDHKQLVSVLNDLCFVSGENIHLLSGVQEYGDLRSRGVADQIQDLVRDNWSTSGFCEYAPKDGQFWWCPGGGSATVYVVHLREPIVERAGTFYPITTYTFQGLTPTAFGIKDGDVVVGCSNGHIYKQDHSLVADAGTAFTPELESGKITLPFGSSKIKFYNLPLKSSSDASLYFTLYRNGKTVPQLQAKVLRSTGAVQKKINMVCDTVQVKLDRFIFTEDLYIGGLIFMIQKLSRWGM